MEYLTDEHYAIAEQNGIGKRLAYNRWYNGWTVQDAITKPKPTPWEDWQEMKEIALAHGVSIQLFHKRMSKKTWTKEEAATTPPMKRGVEYRKPLPKRYKNITPELIAIAESNGISQKLLSIRKSRGWSDERASTEPVRIETFEQKYKPFIELALKNGVTLSAFRDRIRLGWDEDVAARVPIGSFVGRYARKQELESNREGLG